MKSYSFFEGEQYDRELKEYLDGRGPFYFYVVGNHLDVDDYEPRWGSGLPEFLVSESPLTNEQITALVKEDYPEVFEMEDYDEEGDVTFKLVRVN